MNKPSLVERVVARVLSWGGVMGVALMLGGLIVYAAQGQPHARDALRVAQNQHTGLAVHVFTSLADVRRALDHRPPDALGISALGLLCLLATPVTGVAAAIVAFWSEGDRRYAAVASVVLAMLLISLACAGGE
jgi:uncharacterized membrane protein